MKARQILFFNLVGILVVAAALVGGYWYFYNQSHYISENDAYIDVSTHIVASTAAGKLTKWTVQDGSTVHSGDVIGVEQLPTGQTVDVTAPSDGQVLKNNATAGEVVAPGSVLCAVGNLADVYVIANVKETEIRDVKVGQDVDIDIDAYPGESFSGTVVQIESESAAAASPFPTSTSGNFTKEVQRIPVKISLTGTDGKVILPRMNVSVRIHKNNS